MTIDQKKQIQSNMLLLRKKYVEKLKEKVEAIQGFLAQCEQETFNASSRVNALNLCHQMAGTGATYGFPAISSAARMIEDILLANPMTPGAKLTPHLKDLLEACGNAPALTDLITAHASPEAQTPGEEATLEDPDEQIQRLTLPTILVVDDDETVLQLVDTVLCYDAKVIKGENTNEAYILMQQHNPTLVIMDDHMPGSVSGLRFLDEVRRDKILSRIPILMLTASNRKEEVRRGLMSGAVDYISKPFVPGQFAEKIRLHLRKHRSTVLIADDDPAIRSLIAPKFGELGCRIVIAKTGEEALLRMEQTIPDLVILDRNFPDMDGLIVFQKMRTNQALVKIPTFFLTAQKPDPTELEFLRKNAAGYMMKPFNVDELVSRAAKLLPANKK